MKKLSVLILLSLFASSLFASGKIIQETVEIAAKISGKVLSSSSRLAAQKVLSRAFAKYGDDALRIAKKGGLEAIKQGAKYGDDFWRLAKSASPQAVRSLALHADDLMPIAKRLGPDFMRLESKVPGMGAKVVAEFGDDGAKMLARNNVPADDISELIGYAGKADSPETKKLLLKSYRSGGSEFLEKLNWKHIMATGLSAAAITVAYKTGNAVENFAETHPESFKKCLNEFFEPAKVFLSVVLLLLLYPLVKLSIWIGGKIKLIQRSKRKDSDSEAEKSGGNNIEI